MFSDISLNDEQLAAVRYSKGNILLAAGPGSGKTHTMTARIMYLTERKNIDPSRILVITFTKDAAVSMQRRFNNMTDISSPVFF